jgi:hypothetical protein
LFDHRLAGAEPTRHGNGTALDDGKEQIEHALSGDERAVARKPASEGSPFADRPRMRKRQRGAVIQRGDRVRHGESPLLNIRDSAFQTRRYEDLVVHPRAFFDDAQRVAARYRRAPFDGWRKRPAGLRV